MNASTSNGLLPDELKIAIATAREEGETLTAMAETLGVTRQRVLRFVRGD